MGKHGSLTDSPVLPFQGDTNRIPSLPILQKNIIGTRFEKNLPPGIIKTIQNRFHGRIHVHLAPHPVNLAQRVSIFIVCRHGHLLRGFFKKTVGISESVHELLPGSIRIGHCHPDCQTQTQRVGKPNPRFDLTIQQQVETGKFRCVAS